MGKRSEWAQARTPLQSTVYSADGAESLSADLKLEPPKNVLLSSLNAMLRLSRWLVGMGRQR
jgi:hypothetical protein